MDQGLYEIGKWAIKSMQGISYLPLTYRKKTGFQFSICSLTVLHGFVLNTVSILWVILFFLRRQEYSRLTQVTGNTESFAETFVIIGASVIGIFTRMMNLIRVRSTLTFWKATASMLERVATTFRRIPALHIAHHCHLFERIYKDLRKYALMYFIPTFVHVCGFHGYSLLSSLFHDDWLLEIELWVGTGYWICLACLHTAHSLWILLFLKIYSAAFKIVASDMRGDAGRKCWEDSMGQVDKTQKAVIYFGEMQHLQSGKLSQLEYRLRHGMEMFQIVKAEVKRFNAHFAVQLVAELANCIVSMLVFLFFAILSIGRGQPQNAMPLAIPIFLHALKIYRLGTGAGLVTKAAKEVLSVIQSQPLHLLSPELQLKVGLFTTSVLTNPPFVTAGHFFTINRSLLTSILSSMTTFLIVLVQFKESDTNLSLASPFLRKPFSNSTRFCNRTGHPKH